MRGIRKILVAVNNSLDGVREGIKLAEDEKTWLTVLKVLPSYEGDLDLTGIKNIKDVINVSGNSVAAEIKQLAATERTLIKTRLETGEIDKKIVEVAQEERCDLIIMGARKTGFFERLFGANIVEKVINQAPCPVFVVGA